MPLESFTNTFAGNPLDRMSEKRGEADWIAEEIKRLTSQEGRAWTDVAVLYRVNALSRPLEDALLRHGVPYHVQSGHRFYDRAEIRRVAAYLRLALDRADPEMLEGIARGLKAGA